MSETRAVEAGRDGAIRNVGIGEWSVGRAPGLLGVLGLGSCVAVFLYDSRAGVGGLAHALLPYEPDDPPGYRPGRCIPSAIRGMVRELLEAGARKERLSAKLVGGASMFRWSRGADAPPIGDRNVRAAMRCLREHGIRVAASEVGGRSGRSLVVDLADASVRIRSLRGGDRTL